TVKYTDDDSYFPDWCGCKTCNPDNPPEAPRHDATEDIFVEKEGVSGGKHVRRGGRRRKAKKQSV
ncbi:hypothetical protein L208DRAFT_1417857, partial [Tricholoma matsutake]